MREADMAYDRRVEWVKAGCREMCHTVRGHRMKRRMRDPAIDRVRCGTKCRVRMMDDHMMDHLRRSRSRKHGGAREQQRRNRKSMSHDRLIRYLHHDLAISS